MAGSGRRVFAPGEVLTASNVMNYLQDQAVMNFAGTAARGSAIGTAVAEGMVSYLQDSNAVQVYDGSAWQNIPITIYSNVTALEDTAPGTSGKPYNMSAGTATSSASANVTVTFPTSRFSVAPIVNASTLGGANAVVVPYIASVSSTNFTFSLYTTAAARVAQNFQWVAVQMTSGTASG